MNSNNPTPNPRTEEMEIDLLDLLAYYQQRFLWIVGSFLLGALIAGAVTHFAITPKYTATSTMYMVSSSSQSVVDLTDLNIGQSLSKDYVELLKTRPIIEDVIKDQGLDYTYEQVLGMLQISVVSDTRIMKISVTSEDREEAKLIANDLAEKALKELPKLMEAPEPHIAEYAITPEHKSSPSLTRNTMMGALIGTLIILAIFTVRYLLDDTFKTAEDLEREFGVMPLTVIAEGKIEGLTDAEAEKKRRRKKQKNRRRKSE